MEHSLVKPDSGQDVLTPLFNLLVFETAKDAHRKLYVFSDCEGCQQVESLENKAYLLESEL